MDDTMKKAKIVDESKCELLGPYECPHCEGHLKVDVTYIEQVTEIIVCPYCENRIICVDAFDPVNSEGEESG